MKFKITVQKNSDAFWWPSRGREGEVMPGRESVQWRAIIYLCQRHHPNRPSEGFIEDAFGPTKESAGKKANAIMRRIVRAANDFKFPEGKA